MALIIVIFVFGGLILEGVLKSISDASKTTKELYHYNKANNEKNRQQLWDERVSSLRLNLEDAIYVLKYLDRSQESGIYIYLWYEDGALAMFNSPDKTGKTEFYTYPSQWNIEYIEKQVIDGFYKRHEFCVLSCSDNRKLYFSLDDYDTIYSLLVAHGLIEGSDNLNDYNERL